MCEITTPGQIKHMFHTSFIVHEPTLLAWLIMHNFFIYDITLEWDCNVVFNAAKAVDEIEDEEMQLVLTDWTVSRNSRK